MKSGPRQKRQLQRLAEARKLLKKPPKPKPKRKPKQKPKQKPKPHTEVTAMTISRPRIMRDGSLIYPKKGWEPPPVPDGFTRKTTNLRSSDAWVFLPKFKTCEHRVFKEGHKQSCGCISLLLHCNKSGKLVQITEGQCMKCYSDQGIE
jgi:hypothetical protein